MEKSSESYRYNGPKQVRSCLDSQLVQVVEILIEIAVCFISVDGKCPESRCTFSTDTSLDNQEAADAVLFHMPNFHWDRFVILFLDAIASHEPGL